MKMVALALMLTASAATKAQELFHVTAVEDHIRQNTEPAYATPAHTKRIVGIIAHRKYRLEEAALLSYHFEVGSDYPVLKLKQGDDRIDIGVLDKRGHQRKETLTITAVEEAE